MPATRCPVCRTGPLGLPGCSLCKTCWQLSEECQCQTASAPTPQSVMTNQILSKMATASFMREPPNYATVLGDRKNLTQYIAALKLWAKVSGVNKKNQADYVKYHAFQTVPAYFDTFGEALKTRRTDSQASSTSSSRSWSQSAHRDCSVLQQWFLGSEKKYANNIPVSQTQSGPCHCISPSLLVF